MATILLLLAAVGICFVIDRWHFRHDLRTRQTLRKYYEIDRSWRGWE